jgi:hypothetical protein
LTVLWFARTVFNLTAKWYRQVFCLYTTLEKDVVPLLLAAAFSGSFESQTSCRLISFVLFLCSRLFLVRNELVVRLCTSIEERLHSFLARVKTGDLGLAGDKGKDRAAALEN